MSAGEDVESAGRGDESAGWGFFTGIEKRIHQ